MLPVASKAFTAALNVSMFFPCLGNQCITSPWLLAMPSWCPSQWAISTGFSGLSPYNLAKVGAKLHGLLVYLVKISAVCQAVFANLKTDITVVVRVLA